MPVHRFAAATPALGVPLAGAVGAVARSRLGDPGGFSREIAAGLPVPIGSTTPTERFTGLGAVWQL